MKKLDKWSNGEQALDLERRLMNKALGLLNAVKHEARPAAGRLIFGLDLTGSREPSLRQARFATAAMFDAIKAVGTVTMKLVYYRGTNECRESQWYDDPSTLSRSMLRSPANRPYPDSPAAEPGHLGEGKVSRRGVRRGPLRGRCRRIAGPGAKSR